jgi:hypothetical protein
MEQDIIYSTLITLNSKVEKRLRMDWTRFNEFSLMDYRWMLTQMFDMALYACSLQL